MFRSFWALFFLGIFPLLLMADVTPRIGDSDKDETLQWDFVIRSGDTTQITSGSLDTLSVLGALDTIVTRWYANLYGDINVTIDSRGGTTPRYKIIFETLNKGDETICDSNFVSKFWIHNEGVGDDSAYVNSAVDSILVSNEESSGILIPPLGVYAWRFRIISLSTQVGNTRFILKATVWKEK